MRMESGLDTGPMLASRDIPIEGRDTTQRLHDRLANLGAELIAESLLKLAAGAVREVAQPAEGVSYAAKIEKSEALIDWRRSAAEIDRQVRAFNPWPVAETRLNGERLRIWEAEPLESPPLTEEEPGSVLTAAPEGIDVVCGSGVLRVLRLQLAGRKALPAAEFVRGQRLDGARFTAS